jgi:opacity protein-like surface antigen
MNKRIGLFITMTLIAISAYAGQPDRPIPSANYFSGFYIGGFGGYNYSTTNIDFNQDLDITGTNIQVIKSQVDRDENNGIGGGVLGFGFQACRFYLALDLMAAYLKTSTTIETEHNAESSLYPPSGVLGMESFVTASTNGYYSVALKPGWVVTPTTLLFLQIGAAFTKYTLTVIARQDHGQPGTQIYTLSKEKCLSGVQAGIGFDKAITRRWHFFGKYLYTYFKSLNESVSGFNTSQNISTGITAKARATMNTILLGISLVFG